MSMCICVPTCVCLECIPICLYSVGVGGGGVSVCLCVCLYLSVRERTTTGADAGTIQLANDCTASKFDYLAPCCCVQSTNSLSLAAHSNHYNDKQQQADGLSTLQSTSEAKCQTTMPIPALLEQI